VATLENAATKGGAKAATGKSYKALRKLIDEQCGDKYLTHCNMTREKAKDGTIEWVSAETKEQFVNEGSCNRARCEFVVPILQIMLT